MLTDGDERHGKGNHRWTQMNTDTAQRSGEHLGAAGTCSHFAPCAKLATCTQTATDGTATAEATTDEHRYITTVTARLAVPSVSIRVHLWLHAVAVDGKREPQMDTDQHRYYMTERRDLPFHLCPSVFICGYMPWPWTAKGNHR